MASGKISKETLKGILNKSDCYTQQTFRVWDTDLY